MAKKPIEGEAQEERKKTCFVIGPIGAAGSEHRRKADWLFEGIIRPVFAEHFPGYNVLRSDIISEPGMIDIQMINLLHEAEIVIADMTGQNANAFYEMGIRHVLGLPIVHMFEIGTEIPFDVKPHRAIPFTIANYRDLEAGKFELLKNLQAVTAPNFVVENPVTRARGYQAAKEKADPTEKVLFDEIADLKAQISRLNAKGAKTPAPPILGTDVVSLLSVTIIKRPATVCLGLKEGASTEELMTVANLLNHELIKAGFSTSALDQDDFQVKAVISMDENQMPGLLAILAKMKSVRPVTTGHVDFGGTRYLT
ncbi:hypothetical protein [Agrobacterium vitis]|uniref:hypothetical protein n=1 Tax=Agrobacterium vitis TaxID=373 RepID=UPI003D287A66